MKNCGDCDYWRRFETVSDPRWGGWGDCSALTGNEDKIEIYSDSEHEVGEIQTDTHQSFGCVLWKQR